MAYHKCLQGIIMIYVLTDLLCTWRKSIFWLWKGPVNCMGPKWCFGAVCSKVALWNFTEVRTFVSVMKGWDPSVVTKPTPHCLAQQEGSSAKQGTGMAIASACAAWIQAGLGCQSRTTSNRGGGIEVGLGANGAKWSYRTKLEPPPSC